MLSVDSGAVVTEGTCVPGAPFEKVEQGIPSLGNSEKPDGACY